MNFKSPFLTKGLALFSLTQILGIYFARKILAEAALIPINDISAFSVSDFIYLIIAISLFLFFTLKFPKFGAFLFRTFLTLIIFSASQLILSLWFNQIFALVGAIGITAVFWIYPSVILQNLIMIFSMATLGAIFGLSLTPIAVVWILVIFSFYDIIAVYITGHMVKMAESMLKAKAIFGLIIPKSASGFKESMKRVEVGEQFMILGSGDVILPLILSVSLIRVSLLQSTIVAVFSALGFITVGVLFASQKIRRPMAALPPIAALSIIGYLIGLLIIR